MTSQCLSLSKRNAPSTPRSAIEILTITYPLARAAALLTHDGPQARR